MPISAGDKAIVREIETGKEKRVVLSRVEPEDLGLVPIAVEDPPLTPLQKAQAYNKQQRALKDVKHIERQ